ncbi:hypothetical protein [Streptomyces pratensis]|uniref:hypothetical protein n=1 Tax=Streptomyces pratensis TaxID=1169025 RepID=UPI0030181E5E
MNHPNLTLLPTVASPGPSPARPLDLRVRVQRIQIDELVVEDPRLVLAHARRAVRTDPDAAALLGYSPAAPLSLPAATALLCALHEAEELTGMGLRPARRTTRVTASDQQTEPVSLVLSDTPRRQEG